MKTTKKVSSHVADAAMDASKKGKASLFARFFADDSKWQPAIAVLLFLVIWALLGFYESALLRRTESLSLFVFDATFYNSMLSVPAGALSLVGSFLVQFFHYPALGAAIYVLLLYAVFRMTRKVFDVPSEYTLLALLPVVALLASNTQLGYWLFYLKMPGYYYMALLATLSALLAMWACKGIGNVARTLLVTVWVIAGFPLMGVYALASALLIAMFCIALSTRHKERLLFPAVAFVVTVLLVLFVPRLYYNICYNSIAIEDIYMAGVPVTQWNETLVEKVEYLTSSFWHNIYLYWIPFVLLLLFFLGFVLSYAFRCNGRCPVKLARTATVVALLLSMCFGVRFWFSDNNFRIENKQNIAIWEEDWRTVADYAKDSDDPTRQIVLNKNLALLKLGRAGNEMFAYPDGGVLPVSPLAVHMTHTDGSLIYYNLGRFNYCYRWCMENSVEYGWRYEYLKSAVRSMLLSGEFRLAERYINILKNTMFYRGWAREMETYVNEPALIQKNPALAQPLKYTCYNDILSVDDVVEKYVMDAIDANMTGEQSSKAYLSSLSDAFAAKDSVAFGNSVELKQEITPEFVEASLAMALVKKDSKRFVAALNLFIRDFIKGVDMNDPKSVKQLPRHYQEALLLFLTLDKGKTVQVGEEFLNAFVNRGPGGVETNFMRFQSGVAKARDELRRTYPYMAEERLNAVVAALLKREFGNTYYYYYFFVKKIMTY